MLRPSEVALLLACGTVAGVGNMERLGGHDSGTSTSHIPESSAMMLSGVDGREGLLNGLNHAELECTPSRALVAAMVE